MMNFNIKVSSGNNAATLIEIIMEMIQRYSMEINNKLLSHIQYGYQECHRSCSFGTDEGAIYVTNRHLQLYIVIFSSISPRTFCFR